MWRKRRATEKGEFQDPLKNYDPPVYEDDLERAFDEDRVTQMNAGLVKCISPETTVEEALQILVDLDIACLLITEDDRLQGILSERDVLYKLTDNYEQAKHLPVRLLMTANPMVVYETDSPAKAMNMMAVGGFRHIPILDMDDRVVGILGPKRVTTYVEKFFMTA